ncbi:erythromycin esterase family protein [Parageobacillus thermoglucosidasius]|uniref:Erythromycin esterase n=1 Tax=Parageobacillus thermoglucosidasius TaxID=1426 RepID=A0A1B7KMY2_PARTM|nr:erythromycin esterase family protein [Parageobacillus thermoglucosidasius]OAT71422.1 erythromycin esterase [Parageobacillus thermoglucosidasius]
MFYRKNHISSEIDWLKDHTYNIQLHEFDDDSDLYFLKPLLQNKRIVFLGENGHGVAEHSQIKTKMIKYLHKKLGFRVLAFESSFSDCSLCFYQQDQLDARQWMKHSLFKVWHTEEVETLFHYVKETQLSNQPLILTGLDIQPASSDHITGKFLAKVFPNMDKAYGEKIIELEQEMLYQYVNSRNPSISKKERKRKCKELMKLYQEFLLLLDENSLELQNKFGKDVFLLVNRILQNRISLMQMISSRFMKAIKIRNKEMADNISWLAQEMFPNEKIIIWAHNGHIVRQSRRLLGFSSTFSYLPPKIKEFSYTIGFFMYSGQAAENNRSVYEVQQPGQDSIEFRIKQAGHEIGFFDISQQRKVPQNRWLFQHTYTMHEGKQLSLIKPSACYDGLVVCAKTSSPKYINLD